MSNVTLKSYEDFKKTSDCFLKVELSNKYAYGINYVVNDVADNYISRYTVKYVQKLKFSDLTDFHAFLDANTTLSIYKDILQNFRYLHDDSDVFLYIFSNAKTDIDYD